MTVAPTLAEELVTAGLDEMSVKGLRIERHHARAALLRAIRDCHEVAPWEDRIRLIGLALEGREPTPS